MSKSNIPAPFDIKNMYNSQVMPSTFHASNTGLSVMLQRYLMQKVLSRFKFYGIPDTWSENYFKYSIFGYGWVSVLETENFGVIPQNCQLTGFDVFYRPTTAVISNYLIPGTSNLLIDYKLPLDLNQEIVLAAARSVGESVDGICCLIQMQPNYGSAWDLVVYYADLMATALSSAQTNLQNTKFAHVFIADNKAQAESFKKAFDEIESGNAAVFMDKSLFREDGNPNWVQFCQNIKNVYVAGDIMEDVKKIEAQFDTRIGIPNVNIAKASGVSSSEVNANNAETMCLCQLWLDTIRDGLQRVNERYGLNISVELSDLEGGASDGNIEPAGTV